MSKDLPWFKFDPSVWLTGDISDEPDNIQGIFIRITAIYWLNNCDLTIDKLQRKVHKSKVKALIDAGFIFDRAGAVSIPFLDEQRAELLALSNKRSEAGRRGGQANVKQTLSKIQANVNHKDKEEDKDKEVDKDIGLNQSNIKIDFLEDKKTNTKKFIKPTVEEVALYCNERKNKVNPDRFVNFYESNGWRVGKNPMRDWRSAVRTWEQNNIDNKPNNKLGLNGSTKFD
jgi:hypothetical protein